jgi:hypothetical protein
MKVVGSRSAFRAENQAFKSIHKITSVDILKITPKESIINRKNL